MQKIDSIQSATWTSKVLLVRLLPVPHRPPLTAVVMVFFPKATFIKHRIHFLLGSDIMDSLESKVYDYLSLHPRPKIHISEITKHILVPEEQIRDVLLKMLSQDPSVGNFDYSTGWLEREFSIERVKVKKDLAIFLLGIGILLVLFVPFYGLIVGFLMIGHAMITLVKMYWFPKMYRKVSLRDTIIGSSAAFNAMRRTGF
ncbi:MAG: hypothetical protein ACFFBD_16210 [Candidatus Hodarchaeota archaeon]